MGILSTIRFKIKERACESDLVGFLGDDSLEGMTAHVASGRYHGRYRENNMWHEIEDFDLVVDAKRGVVHGKGCDSKGGMYTLKGWCTATKISMRKEYCEERKIKSGLFSLAPLITIKLTYCRLGKTMRFPFYRFGFAGERKVTHPKLSAMGYIELWQQRDLEAENTTVALQMHETFAVADIVQDISGADVAQDPPAARDLNPSDTILSTDSKCV
mmetsp:Transcript_13224/g.21494  ORF Transcript_13224/g.21494 Transcript_13224/m.21494 type:complete len:215 (-) Transcript_13224:238-882(-)